MILSVEELRQFITTDVSDMVLEVRLSALETSIRQKTHNNFQDRRYRTIGDVEGDTIRCDYNGLFEVGDTIMVNDDLVVIEAIYDGLMTISEDLPQTENALITKVRYPMDVVMGVIDVIGWMLDNPSEKAGVSSETISRHSVSYMGSSEFDSDIGCPSRLLSFLNQYKKARF